MGVAVGGASRKPRVADGAPVAHAHTLPTPTSRFETPSQTNERKEQMCLLVREALTVGKIAFHRNFFSLELGAAGAKRQIKDELLSYCVVTEPAKTMFGKVRRPTPR